MPKTPSSKPRSIPQVMVSSTFTDLKEHRAALIRALNEHGLHPKVMEYDSAKPVGPHCQESCPLGLIHPPGGLTDDHEKDLRPRCAGASPRANESTKPGERG
jgi:hypothetical protein